MKMDLETLPEAALRQANVDKRRSVLLVIDPQEYFREILQPILSDLLRTLDACRKAKVPVIFTQHGYQDPSKESGMLGQWWDDPMIVGTEKWKLISEIVPNREEKILRKKRYSAFYETELDGILKTLGVKDVVIAGVMTNLCCETTARDAFVRDYRVFFLVDGTATVSEDYHLATLKNLAYGFAYLKTCDTIVAELR